MLHTKPTSHFKTSAIISIIFSQVLLLITASSVGTKNGTGEPSKERGFHDRNEEHHSHHHSSSHTSSSSSNGFVGGLPIFFWFLFGAILLITCITVICGLATRGRCGGGGYGPGYGGYGPYGGGYHHHNTGCVGGGYHDHHHHGGCYGGGGHYHSGFHSHSTIFDSGW